MSIARNDEITDVLHDIKQPLNVIRLTCANVRVKIIPYLEPEQRTYMTGKLERIESQIAKAIETIEKSSDRFLHKP